MRILEGLVGLEQLPPGSAMTIGNFDGMHLGHRTLLETVGRLKTASRASATVVVTFEPHPLTVLRPDRVPPRLTLPEYKRHLLAEAGVDILVILPPSQEVLNLSAERFWQILRDQVRPAYLVEGASFTFGKNRGGTIDTLREWSAGSEVQLQVVDPVNATLLNMLDVPVSSSVIRWLLAQGRVRDAAICLGRPYRLEGIVIEGAKRGRELGVPTANLNCLEQLIPADGIYVARTMVAARPWPVALSIGTNPTFGNNPRTVEAHLIHFAGDLYGQVLHLQFVDWIRDQQTFSDIEALKNRIATDIEESLARSSLDPARALA
ncbi:MAG TPA: riboflavin biosynthesis protein RibF [Tepidisphaeraceae bacterium]|jgi:riboflavin kinase/FMN adenylyltransferase